jgi:hypothetical protein
MAQMQGYVQQLEEELKGLKGDLQTSEREEIHAKKRLEVEKFKTGLNTASARANAATELYRQRMSDEVSMRGRESMLDMREIRIENKRAK